MAKQLTLKWKNTTYTLEYTRKTVEAMERQGFVAGDITDKPMLTIPALFAGAFKANHPKMKPQQIREIYDQMPRRDELIGKLAEMYNEPIAALLDEPEESEGNVSWTASW